MARPVRTPKRTARARSAVTVAAAAAASLPAVPCVLAIGELDPGAGAGVLADARAVARTGAFGCAVVAVLTVQSTSGMREATAVATAEVLAACHEVVKNQRVRAIKVGALGSEDNARGVGDFLAIHRDVPAVVDTVLVPSRGRARLLEERAVTALRDRVLRHAALVTVNAHEAEVLTGLRVTRLDEAHDAALALLRLGCRAVLVKGGHLSGPHAIDLLATASAVVELSAPRLSLHPLEGSGCVLASLIAGKLATREDARRPDAERTLSDAVRWAKRRHHAALSRTRDVGGDLRVLFA